MIDTRKYLVFIYRISAIVTSFGLLRFLTLTAKCALYGEYAVLNNATLVKAWNQIFYALSFKDSWTSQKGLSRLQELFNLMASCASHWTPSNFQGAHWTFILFMAIFHIKPSSSKAASWIEKKTFWSGLESYSRIFWIQCLYFLPNLDLKICFPNFTTHAKSILELVKLKTSQIWIGMLKTES